MYNPIPCSSVLIPVSRLCSLFSNSMRRVPQPDLYEFIGMPRRRKLTVPRRKKKETAAEGEIWEVRAILDEGTNEEGVSAYLIDWAPDKTTGKEYDPEWVRDTLTSCPTISDIPTLIVSRTSAARERRW